MVGQAIHIVCQIGVEFSATRWYTRSRVAHSGIIFAEPLAIGLQPSKASCGGSNFSMPQIPSQLVRGPPEQHRDAREPLGLQQSPYSVLNAFDAHRNMPPIEDMANRPANGVAHQIGQCGFSTRNRDNRALAVPASFFKILPYLPRWRLSPFLYKPETAAHVRTLDLNHHNIERPLLVFRPAPNMRTVQKDSHRSHDLTCG